MGCSPGDTECDSDEKPTRQVEIPGGLWLGQTPVTVGAWKKYRAATGQPSLRSADLYGRKLNEAAGDDNLPAVAMTWDEGKDYCEWSGGRLPTEDEWLAAAAGEKTRRYPWGDTGAVCRRAAWGLATGPCAWGAQQPELAGAHPDGASPEGVLDLAGNVAEWAVAADGSAEVRGGSFADGAASALRSWQRHALSPDTRSPQVGFRCAQSAP